MTAPTPLAPPTASASTANVSAKRVGKARTPASWTRRPDSVCQIALDTEGSIWRRRGVTASQIGLERIVQRGCVIWIVGSMAGQYTRIIKLWYSEISILLSSWSSLKRSIKPRLSIKIDTQKNRGFTVFVSFTLFSFLRY